MQKRHVLFLSTPHLHLPFSVMDNRKAAVDIVGTSSKTLLLFFLFSFLVFKASSSVIFLGTPYIRLIPKVTAVAGETLRLKCPVAGYPIEEIYWEKNNKQLPTEIRQSVERDGTLVITSVQKDSDVGVYTCVARNKQGQKARRTGEVSVIGIYFFFIVICLGIQ